MRQITSSLWLSALAAAGAAAIGAATAHAYPGAAAGAGAAPGAAPGATAAGTPTTPGTAAGSTGIPGTTGAATAPGSNPPAAGVTAAGTPQTATPTPMTATSQVQTVPGTGQTTAGASQNPNNVVGTNNATGTQTRLGNLPYAGAQPGSLPNQAYGPYGYTNGANGLSAPGNPFTNNPNMAAGAYLTPGYFGTGQFGAYAPNTYGNGSLTAGSPPPGAIGSGYYGSYSPNSYGNAGYGTAGFGNSGYVPGYGADNAAGNYTAGYPPTNGYFPATQNGQTASYRRNGMTRSNRFQANGAARQAAQGRTQYGWW
jgi:collagen type I alpha